MNASKTPTGLTLRELVRATDGDSAARLVRDTGYFREDEVAVARELIEESLARGAASGYELLFADRADGSLAGYACYGRIPLTESSFDLYWIAVDATEQGRGLGRWLLAESERRIAAAGGTQVFVETSGRQQYEPTRIFYERTGYHVAARFANFYAPGDDKVVYVRRLDKEG
ncbi:MAG TPA: GNAT family N-acetyltransferase [Thermoanaerobaculia bacterium]|nr:GNAT family N-acetyltransferase [Thermoanaerobaculia bacterium]